MLYFALGFVAGVLFSAVIVGIAGAFARAAAHAEGLGTIITTDPRVNELLDRERERLGGPRLEDPLPKPPKRD